MKILPHSTAKSSHQFTSRAGLLVPARLLERLELGKMIDRLMPGPGSNRGYRPSAIFHTFMLMLHEGGKCLDDVRHLRKESALMKLLGFRSVPCSSTLGGWLRKVGRSKGLREALAEVNRHLLKVALGPRERVTLDIDASAIHAKKKSARGPTGVSGATCRCSGTLRRPARWRTASFAGAMCRRRRGIWSSSIAVGKPCHRG